MKKILNGVLVDMTDAEISAHIAQQPSDADLLAQAGSAAREQRTVLLTKSDWTQVADAPVDQQAWATYRQGLRDITSQEGFPEAIMWPVAP
tara:strand:+ start:6202 stop:6474 length:273 start_codon:yes stop_codon:yes gene_type:complete